MEQSHNYLEYIGIASFNCTAFPVWSDNSTNLADLDYFTDHVPITGGPDQPVPCIASVDIKPFSDPNSINTKGRGVVPVAICNGGPVLNSVDIIDSTDPDGFSNSTTNVDVSTVRFALGADGMPLDTTTAFSAHDLSDPIVLGGHLTDFIDTTSDGVPDTLVPLEAPNCPGDPAGPDLVVHFRTRDTGLARGDTEACVAADLADGTEIIGCDSVRVVK